MSGEGKIIVDCVVNFQSARIDISQYPAGTYIFHIKTSDGSVTRKVVKKRQFVKKIFRKTKKVVSLQLQKGGMNCQNIFATHLYSNNSATPKHNQIPFDSERCSSGWRGPPGKRVSVKSASGVRIPSFPPKERCKKWIIKISQRFFFTLINQTRHPIASPNCVIH